MPSVSEPGYFCTNGMSESRHDSPFANSGLVVTIEPDELGSDHPLAGIHYQQRFERLAYLAGERTYAAPLQWARDFLSGRPSRGTLPTSYGAAARRSTCGSSCPTRSSMRLEHGLAVLDRRFGGHFLRDATLTGPESRGSSPVRILRDPRDPREPRRRRASTLAARGPATPAASSAPPSTASGRRGRSWRLMRIRSETVLVQREMEKPGSGRKVY